MKKYISLSIVLILCLFTLTGCYDAKSIESYSYAVGIALDKSDSEALKLSIQFAESESGGQSGSTQSNKSSLVSVDCNSISTGISIINNYLNKKVNLAHCSVIVFSEEISKEGIQKYINTFTNNIELRPTCNIVVSKDKASDFLETAGNSAEEFSSRYYEYILNSSDFTGYTTRTPLTTFFSGIKDDTRNSVAIYSETSENAIQNTGLAIFRDDKYIGKISTLDTIFYLMIIDELQNATISIPSPFEDDEYIDIYIVLRKNTKNSNSLVNNSPYIKSNIYVEGQILSSSNKSIAYSDKDTLISLEKSLTDYLEKNIQDFLYKTSKDYDSDICGFGKNLMKKYLTDSDWEKVHWKDIYKNSTFNVKVEANISSSYLFTRQ